MRMMIVRMCTVFPLDINMCVCVCVFPFIYAVCDIHEYVLSVLYLNIPEIT